MNLCQKYSIQIPVNGSLVIPNRKPDLERILRVTAKPVVTKCAVINKKIVVGGYVCIHLEYVACVPGDKQPVHFAAFKVPFANFIKHPCAHPGQQAKVVAIVEYQDYQAMDPRTITKLIIVRICLVKLGKTCEPPDPCTKPFVPGPCSDSFPCPYSATSWQDKQDRVCPSTSTEDNSEVTELIDPEIRQPEAYVWDGNDSDSLCANCGFQLHSDHKHCANCGLPRGDTPEEDF